jgi:Beta-carotene 15,15'-dioxygenase
LKMSHQRIWLHSLPFHAGAWLLMAVFYFLWPAQLTGDETNHWGMFFIFIACLSLPHAMAMHVVYDQKSAESIP